MFDLPKKRIALSSMIATIFFSSSYVNTKLQDQLYSQDKGLTYESKSIAKVEKLRPLIYLEKEN